MTDWHYHDLFISNSHKIAPVGKKCFNAHSKSYPKFNNVGKIPFAIDVPIFDKSKLCNKCKVENYQNIRTKNKLKLGWSKAKNTMTVFSLFIKKSVFALHMRCQSIVFSQRTIRFDNTDK